MNNHHVNNMHADINDDSNMKINIMNNNNNNVNNTNRRFLEATFLDLACAHCESEEIILREIMDDGDDDNLESDSSSSSIDSIAARTSSSKEKGAHIRYRLDIESGSLFRVSSLAWCQNNNSNFDLPVEEIMVITGARPIIAASITKNNS